RSGGSVARCGPRETPRGSRDPGRGNLGVAPDAAFDVAVMSAHVAQFLVGDDDWHGTLRDIRRALVPGGRLVFDTRDPRAAAWETWNPVDSRRTVTLSDGTTVETWGDAEPEVDGQGCVHSALRLL
ncbi:MAG TPA: methyltransferase domain-containing protein, partial [Actinomycetes bacterium]|nr:methyltransferase domain-containing protein [Actinomycetes bacterium]